MTYISDRPNRLIATVCFSAQKNPLTSKTGAREGDLMILSLRRWNRKRQVSLLYLWTRKMYIGWSSKMNWPLCHIEIFHVTFLLIFYSFFFVFDTVFYFFFLFLIQFFLFFDTSSLEEKLMTLIVLKKHKISEHNFDITYSL